MHRVVKISINIPRGHACIEGETGRKKQFQVKIPAPTPVISGMHGAEKGLWSFPKFPLVPSNTRGPSGCRNNREGCFFGFEKNEKHCC